MTQFEIMYDSSKVESLQFYNTSTKQFLSPEEAQSLSDQGLGRIVIRRMSTATCSVILHDPECTYWECYYNTDTDKFLCAADATTLVEIGLGQIVAGKIPYIITKEKGIYFDVVKDRRIGEQTALQLVSSGVAVLKNKDSGETGDEFVDASESSLSADNNPGDSLNSSNPPSSLPPSSLPSRGSSSQPGRSSSASQQGRSSSASQQGRSSSASQQGRSSSASYRPADRQTPSSSLRQEAASSSSGPSSSAQEEKEESFFEKVAPIAAGVAVAGVAIAGVAAAMFFGSGGKDKKKKK